MDILKDVSHREWPVPDESWILKQARNDLLFAHWPVAHHEDTPGIYFFSLDANSAIAVGGASSLFHLPYFLADIHADDDRGHLSFRSRRTHGGEAEFEAKYSPAGQAEISVNTMADAAGLRLPSMAPTPPLCRVSP